MPGPDGKEIPATGKTFGFLMAHALELDASRTAVRSDADYFEAGTYLAQLDLSKAPARAVMSGAAEPVVAIAENDEAEARNVATVNAIFEAMMSELVKGLPDASFTPTRVFGAGDCVVAQVSLQGTNKGGLPSMGVKKNNKAVSLRALDIFRLQDGKVAEEWLFYNGAALAAQLGLQ